MSVFYMPDTDNTKIRKRNGPIFEDLHSLGKEKDV